MALFRLRKWLLERTLEPRGARARFRMPCYNAERTFAASPASICEGNLGPRNELIVVDDGSDDGSLNILKGLARGRKALRVRRRLLPESWMRKQA